VAYTYASAKNGSKAGDNVSGLATMAGMVVGFCLRRWHGHHGDERVAARAERP